MKQLRLTCMNFNNRRMEVQFRRFWRFLLSKMLVGFGSAGVGSFIHHDTRHGDLTLWNHLLVAVV